MIIKCSFLSALFAFFLLVSLVLQPYIAPVRAAGSPGGQIAFILEGNIWVMDADGSNLGQLTKRGNYLEVSWSPDGRDLAFVHMGVDPNTQREATEVGVYHLIDRTETIVIPPEKTPFVLLDEYYYYGNPHWAPDSSTIYYTASDNRASGQLVHTVQDHTLVRDINFAPFISLGIDVSPVDGRIASISHESGQTGQNLSWLNPNGSGEWKHLIVPVHGVFIADAVWSRDGKKIILSAQGQEYGDGAIIIASPDGTIEKVLPAPGAGMLAVSPDSAYVVYDGRGSNNLRRMDLESGAITFLPDGKLPTWGSSPLRIEGMVTDVDGKPVTGVAVSLSNGQRTNTDTAGMYAFPIFTPAEYTLTPQKDGLVFLPPRAAVRVVNANQTVNFQALDANDPSEMKKWIDEKSALIQNLKNITIQTSLFSVPALVNLDETQAANLMKKVKDQEANGALSPEQAAAFSRLTLQERSLAKQLDSMTRVYATVSDTFVSSYKTIRAFEYNIDLSWDACNRFLTEPACKSVKAQVDKVIFSAEKLGVKKALPLLTRIVGDPEKAESIYEVAATMVETRLFGGEALEELLKDSAVEAAATQALMLPLLDEDQKLVNKGVESAYLQNRTSGNYPITGDTRRAENLVNLKIEESDTLAKLAESQHKDFRSGAELAEFFSDMTNLSRFPLGKYGNWSAMVNAVSVGMRIEKLIVDGWEITVTGSTIDCMRYLNRKGSELAFDAQQPSSTCDERSESQSTGAANLSLIAYTLPGMKSHPLTGESAQSSAEYRQSIQALQAALESQNDAKIQAAFEPFACQQDQVNLQLDRTVSALLARDSLSEEETALVAEINGFEIDAAVLDLSLLEDLGARKANQTAVHPFEQVARQHLSKLDVIAQQIQQLGLPANDTARPKVSILDVQLHNNDQMKISLVNTGKLEIKGLKITVRDREGYARVYNVEKLQSGFLTSVNADLPTSADRIMRVEVTWNNQLLDQWIGGIQGKSQKVQENHSLLEGKARWFFLGSLLLFGILLVTSVWISRRRKNH